MGWAVLTSGVPSGAVPEMLLGIELDRAGEDQRSQVDGERAAAVGRGQQEVGVRRAVGVGLVGSYGPARLGMPVLESMLPSDRSRSVTVAWGR